MNLDQTKTQIRSGIGRPGYIVLPDGFTESFNSVADKLDALPIPAHDKQMMQTALVGLATSVGNNLQNMQPVKAA